MKRLMIFAVVVTVVAATAPGYAFIDYLFGGSSTTDAIDNSVVGDLRAWWTGNPVYTFNPYYTPSATGTGQPDPSGGRQAVPQDGTGVPYMQPQSNQQFQQPQMNYYPPVQQQQYGAMQPQQGYPAPQAQPYMMPQQQYQAPPQQYPAPQQYQVPQQPQSNQQGYGVLPPQYQPVSRGYQYQMQGAE